MVKPVIIASSSETLTFSPMHCDYASGQKYTSTFNKRHHTSILSMRSGVPVLARASPQISTKRPVIEASGTPASRKATRTPN